MPSSIIHEEVGYFIGKKYNISSYDYYLGLIAPDSPNLEGFAPKEERWTAHQRSANYDEWKENLKNFYKKEKNNYPKDFIFGYALHILTDIIFDEYIYSGLKETIEKSGVSKYDSHNIMSADMQKYYFPEIVEIIETLKKSTSYDILNISKDLMLKWKEKQFDLWPSKNSCVYINESIINKLNNIVLDEMNNLIS